MPIADYKTDFPEAEYDVPQELLVVLEQRGFDNGSWHNDACPRFWNEKLRLAVWTGDLTYGHERYSLERTDADGAGVDDVAGMIAMYTLVDFLPVLAAACDAAEAAQ